MEVETPEWGGMFPAASSSESSSGDAPDKDKGVAPKSWRGLGEWQVLTTGLLTRLTLFFAAPFLQCTGALAV